MTHEQYVRCRVDKRFKGQRVARLSWCAFKVNVRDLTAYNSISFAVSNEVPEHPCVSPVSNQVFERRLIEKYIAENGADPINGQPLSEEQLVDIKGK